MKRLEKRNSRNLLCYFPDLKDVNLTKDPVQIPNAISNVYKYNSYILTQNKINENLLKLCAPNVQLVKMKVLFEGDRKSKYLTDSNLLKIKKTLKEKKQTKSVYAILMRFKDCLNKLYQQLYFISYLLINSRRIQYLYLYNFGPNTNFDVALFGILFKVINPKGILHVRLEIGVADLSKSFPVLPNRNFKTSFLNRIYRNFLKRTSILGIIDDENLSVSRSYPVFWSMTKDKLKQQLNGYNLVSNTKVKSFDEKDNYITIVGRLTSDEKGLKIL